VITYRFNHYVILTPQNGNNYIRIVSVNKVLHTNIFNKCNNNNIDINDNIDNKFFININDNINININNNIININYYYFIIIINIIIFNNNINNINNI